MPRVVHFEIHTDDPDRAIAFYRAVFGWDFPSWMDGYWGVMTGEEGVPGINGGLMRRQGPAPVDGQAVNSYVCTVDVPSVDDYVARVTAAGGAIALPKMAVPGVGWLAYAKDTEGNIFGMMQDDPAAA